MMMNISSIFLEYFISASADDNTEGRTSMPVSQRIMVLTDGPRFLKHFVMMAATVVNNGESFLFPAIFYSLVSISIRISSSSNWLH